MYKNVHTSRVCARVHPSGQLRFQEEKVGSCCQGSGSKTTVPKGANASAMLDVIANWANCK